jgi:alkylation response protein AidB-like acyl-CoA dehydrogenase
VATGIAQAALDALVELAQTKVPMFAAEPLKQRAPAQEAIGRAEALLGAARAYRAATVAEIWAMGAAGGPFTPDLRLRARLAATHAVDSAARAVDLMYRAGGTTSIWDDCTLSRCFRDVHVVAQNWSVLPQTYEAAGRVRLGLEIGLLV